MPADHSMMASQPVLETMDMTAPAMRRVSPVVESKTSEEPVTKELTLWDTRLSEARALAQSNIHFAFMEFRRLVREFRNEPVSREAEFAVGEYYYEVNDPADAVKTFYNFVEKPTGKPIDILALVYLLKTAEKMPDSNAVPKIEKHLKEALASRQILLIFDKQRQQKWESPFRNNFMFKEFVDRLEITRNGSPFYTIQIS